MHFQIERVTPSKAEHYLRSNTINRGMRPKRVKHYADQMTRGLWKVSPHGIVFGKTGRLLDGQHRLKAVIDSGTPVNMVVFTDVEDSLYDVMDAGMPRSLADRTGLSKDDVSICSLIIRMVFGSGEAIAVNDLEYVYDKLSDALEIFWDRASGRKRQGIGIAPVQLAVILHIIEGHGDYAIQQYKAMCRLDYTEFTPAVASFFKQVTEGKVTGSARDREELCARAYKALDERFKTTTKIQFKDAEAAIAALADKFEKLIA